MLFGDPLIGQQLANFRIERLLGRGGMAKVYFGWDIKLQRPVAIKVIREEFRNDSAYTERFVREARVVARWQHANIPQIHHAGEEEGVSYFAMEYIEGQNLANHLKEYADQGKLPPYEEVLRIGKAVAEALDYAHQRGVIHRDVTPANVMLAEDGRIMLMDFGLARAVIEETRGEVLGSPHYVSPEQARNSAEAVPQSDLYSLGVILYEMLVGGVPFDDPSPTSLAMNHIISSPPAPREMNPDLSRAVESVLLKALRKSPSERYQSGRELIEALERALGDETLDSVPGTLPMLPEKTRPIPAQQQLISTKPLMVVKKRQDLKQPGQPALDQKQGKLAGFRFKTTPLVLGAFGCGILLIIAALAILTSVSLASVGRDRATQTSAIGLVVSLTPSSESGLAGSLNSTPTATPSNSMTGAPTKTPTRTSTATLTPSATASTTSTPTVTPAWDFALVILTNGDDSLFVVNEGERDFPLGRLEIKNERGSVSGDEWEIEFLEEGECVAVWKDSGKPKPPKNLDCEEVGERLERDGEHKFWTSAYEVFYDEELIKTCADFREECEITKEPGN